MSMITEQVKRLRDAANRFDAEGAEPSDGDLMREAANTIEQLAAKVRAENGGGWIPTADRLPEERINPITKDFYPYQCTFKNGDVYDVRFYQFGQGHWWHGLEIYDGHVTAWRERPEPYKEDGETDE